MIEAAKLVLAKKDTGGGEVYIGVGILILETT